MRLLWVLRSCGTVLRHVMWGRPQGLLPSSGGKVDSILLASVLSSIHAMCPKRVRRRDWTIAVSLGCHVSLRTSSLCGLCLIVTVLQHQRGMFYTDCHSSYILNWMHAVLQLSACDRRYFWSTNRWTTRSEWIFVSK